MRILCIICGCLLTLLISAGAHAYTRLMEKAAVYQENTMTYALPSGGEASFKVRVLPVADSDWVYVKLVGDEAPSIDKTPVIFVFDSQGKLVVESTGFDVSTTLGVSLSPLRNIIALDNGQGESRAWNFFALPGFRPMGRPLAYARSPRLENHLIAWITNNFVVAPTVSEPRERELKCGADPDCGNYSLVLYNVERDILMPLFQGTDLCNYYYTGALGRTIIGEKECVASVEDWQNKDKPRRGTRVIGKLPAGR